MATSMALTCVLHQGIKKPPSLDASSWEAISSAFDRLERAVADDDRALIVGSAKELVESVARVILKVRGEQVGDSSKYSEVLKRAHDFIQYQQGQGVSSVVPVRQVASNAKKMADSLRELRNSFGTGHGRSGLNPVEDEVIEICIDGALVWTRWALHRIEPLIYGQLAPLLNDLRDGGTFRRGTLAARLLAANLSSLEEDDLRGLGLAVGQRAATGTFVVREDGVAACADSDNLDRWPAAYREGLVRGLFIEASGRIADYPSPELAARVIAPHPDPVGVLVDLKEELEEAPWNPVYQAQPEAVIAEIQSSRGYLAADARGIWSDIESVLRSRPGFG